MSDAPSTPFAVQLRPIGRKRLEGDFDVAPSSNAENNDSFLPHTANLSTESRLQVLREAVVKERLLAYCEDLAEWLTMLFHIEITAETFGHDIENGVILLRLARLIEVGTKDTKKTRGFASTGSKKPCPPAPMDYTEKPTTPFHKRDNLSRFIEWVRKLGVDEAVIFEADDLVGRKNEKNVLYCLMELARVQGGVEPPKLVQLERLIDSGQLGFGSEAEERNAIARIKECLRMMEYPLDNVERVGPGRYDVADFGVLTIGILRNHVMVRLQNSWDTLQHFIMTHGSKVKKAPMARPSVTAPAPTTTSRGFELGPIPAPIPAPAPAPTTTQPRRDSVADELAALRKLLEEKERRIIQLENSLRDMSKNTDRMNELNAERTSLLERQRQLMDRVAQLEGQMTLYQNADKDQQEMIQHITVVENELQTKTQQMSDRDRQIAELTKQLQAADAELDQMEQHHIEERARDAGDSAVQLKRAQDDHAQRASDLEAQLRTLKAQNGELTEEVDELKRSLQRATDSYSAVQDRVRTHDADKAASDDELARLRARIKELEEENAHLRRALDDISQQLAEERARRQALEKQCNDLISQLSDTTAAHDEDMAQAAAREQQYQDDLANALKSADERAQQQDKSAQAREQDLAAQHANQLAALQQRLLEAQTQRDEHSAASKACAERGQGLQSRIGDLERDLAAATAAAKAASKDKEAVNQQRTEDQRAHADALSDAQNKHSDEKKQLQRALEDAENVKETLRARLSQSAADVTRKDHENIERASDLERRLKETERRLEDTVAQARRNQDEAEAAQRARDANHDARLKEARDDASQAHTDLGAAKRSIADLEAALAKTKRDGDALQDQLRDMEGLRASDSDKGARALQDATQKAKDNAARAAQLERDLNAALGRAERGEATAGASAGELEAAKREIQGLKAAAETAGGDKRRLEQRVQGGEQRIGELEAALEVALQHKDADSRELSDAAGKIATQERKLAEAQDAVAAMQDRLSREQQAAQAQLQQQRDADQRARDREAQLQQQLADAQAQLREKEAAARNSSDRNAAIAETEKAKRMESDKALQDAQDRLAQMERDLAAAKATAARVGPLEQTAQSLKERAERPAVTVPQAIINANIAEADRLTEPQLQVLAQVDPAVAESLAARDRSLMGLADAEDNLVDAAKALDAAGGGNGNGNGVGGGNGNGVGGSNGMKPDAAAKLAQAQHARELAGQQAANDQALLSQDVKRALERLRLGQLRNSGKLDGGATTGMPALGLSSADAVVRIAELEDMLAADGQEHSRTRGMNDELKRKLEELEKSKVPAERDDLRLYRENIANWLNALLGTDFTEKNLMESLEDGCVLSAASNVIDDAEQRVRDEEAANGEPLVDGMDPNHVARTRVINRLAYDNTATPGTPTARTNVDNFINWCRGLGISNPDIFTPPDLVERNDDWAVLVGLFDLARCTRGVPLPPLVAMERAQALARTSIPKAVKNDPIDQVVTQVMSENPNFRVKRVAEGRYIFGQRVLLMRILHGTVMVRVGGGWEELRSYLVKHAGRAQRSANSATEAEAAVEAIRQSAGGVGLHTTRTRVRGAFE